MAKADKTSKERRHREAIKGQTFCQIPHSKCHIYHVHEYQCTCPLNLILTSRGSKKPGNWKEKNKKKTTLPEWRKGYEGTTQKSEAKCQSEEYAKQRRKLKIDEKVLLLFLVFPLDFTERE